MGGRKSRPVFFGNLGRRDSSIAQHAVYLDVSTPLEAGMFHAVQGVIGRFMRRSGAGMVLGMRFGLGMKLIAAAGGFLFLSVFSLAWLAGAEQKDQALKYASAEADRLATTIKLGLHYAMLLNAREDMTQIVSNVSKQKDILSIRVYNKEGVIKFSNRPEELENKTNIKAEACDVCHRTNPPQIRLELAERTRLMTGDEGGRRIGILTPIHNEQGCSEGCHFHPKNKQILGAIDTVITLAEADADIVAFQGKLGLYALGVLALTALPAGVFVNRFVGRPMEKLIESTRRIARGETPAAPTDNDDEIGRLAQAVNTMAREITDKQRELNRQRDEYQNLFANAPCIITVQDRDYRLLRWNRGFSNRFKPRPGEHCWKVYKGRDEKCPNCPVEKTFADGKSHSSEESGCNQDGEPRWWLVTTAPLKNEEGEVVAAMEMSIDISSRKQLERDLKRSEERYAAIFNQIPNPVFVLDPNDFSIMTCNDSVRDVYGCDPNELIGGSFLDLFPESDRERVRRELPERRHIERAPQLAKDGRKLYADVLVSPSEYGEKRALMVTTSDVTERLETERKLIQAGKMTTLGEMAAGVAHELNQPLTVIKSAGSYILKKIRKTGTVDAETLADLTGEIDSHVDRAVRIINHLREFGRKPEMDLSAVDPKLVLGRALELFSKQLALRGVDVVWDFPETAPEVIADAGSLEQVFINLVVNARDAVEDRAACAEGGFVKRIVLSGRTNGEFFDVRVTDTGSGVPKAARDRIFEPFFTTKAPGKGTGLGLSISYGIIKDFGGEIALERTGPEGSTFRISLKTAGEGHERNHPAC